MSTEPATAKGATEITEPSRLRQQLARRVAESRATMPDVTLTGEADLQDALAAIPGATPRDLVVRAAALALREQPAVNGAYRDGHFEAYTRVNVAFAVDTGDGLVLPTIFDADTKSAAAVAAEAAELAAGAAELPAPRTAGATCSVVAVDAPGVRRVVPPLQQPQAVVLGVGAVAERPVVRDGAIVARQVADVTLVADHRIVYGDAAAAFLSRVLALLADPAAL